MSRVLLDRYGIRRRTTAYHEHNAGEAGPKLIAALQAGQSVALISDAGTPLVSDPGYRLVGEALDHGIRVVPIPGPSAPLAALTASGLPSDAFLFAGFLPVKTGQRLTRLEALKAVPATLIFFKSPRRLAESLGAMVEALGGERKAAIGRELTKTFEEMRTGTLQVLANHYAAADTPKGEIVVCVGPAEAKADEPADIDRLLLSLAAEMPASKAAAEAAKMTGGRSRHSIGGCWNSGTDHDPEKWKPVFLDKRFRLSRGHGQTKFWRSRRWLSGRAPAARRPIGAAIAANGWRPPR